VGTPVVAGLHDVTASALGSGGYADNVVAVIAGTYSINETLSPQPRMDQALVLPQRHRARPVEQHVDLTGIDRQLRLVPRHALRQRAPKRRGERRLRSCIAGT
jgi:hypothetical protein